ncbi:DUF6246 family protein [Comamonadaceae bacterium OTU4NAUVB1]|nr:DUF6246 family protein [Comamonadaceae bacterium OTU4NAUVB1]
MLVECGFTRATTADGQEFTFRPSFGRISTLGDPQAIVRLYAGLFGARAAQEARYVLACLCDQVDVSPLIGWAELTAATDDGVLRGEWLGPRVAEGDVLDWHAGAMPALEQVILARHLMQHGIVGKARPETATAAQGKFSDRFDASEFVSAARVHLGLSSEDAEALSMTEFQTMFEMKFPDKNNQKRDVPTRAEYEAGMARFKGNTDG